MNCKRCQAQLSDFLDRSLSESVREQVTAHLASCPTCRAEVRDLKKALETLREAGAEAPPSDLAGRITAAIVAEAVTPLTGGGPSPKMGWYSIAAAAVLLALLGGLAGFTMGRHWQPKSDVVQLPTGPADEFATELRELQRQWAEEKARLAESRRLAEANWSRLQKELETQLASEKAQREGLQATLTTVESDQTRLQERIEKVGDELTRARRQVVRLEGRLRAQPPEEEIQSVAKATGDEPVEGSASAAATSLPPVRFRSRGGRLQVELSGARSEVIQLLLGTAAQGGDPERARLALSTLENLLADGADVETEAPPTPGLLARNLGAFASDVGLVGFPSQEVEVTPTAADSFRERLQRVRLTWKKEQSRE